MLVAREGGAEEILLMNRFQFVVFSLSTSINKTLTFLGSRRRPSIEDSPASKTTKLILHQ